MNIDPYGPMLNMRPIQNKRSYTADDIKAMNILTCASCGARVQKRSTNLCDRCLTELMVELEAAKIYEHEEGEA